MQRKMEDGRCTECRYNAQSELVPEWTASAQDASNAAEVRALVESQMLALRLHSQSLGLGTHPSSQFAVTIP